ncbi:MAG: hypothetical protein ACKKL4_01035 [Patescibacteria group bacterium]
MATKHNEDIMEDENFYSSEEETEYYDMSAFERRLMRQVSIMDDKLNRILHMMGDNNSRVRNIQSQYTRRTIFALIKWGVIIAIIAYVYLNFIQPVINFVTQKDQEQESMMVDVSQIGNFVNGFFEKIESSNEEK